MYWYRWFELTVFFVITPLLITFMLSDKGAWLMPILGGFGVACLVVLLTDPKFKRFRLWHTTDFKQHLKGTLRLFIPCALLTTFLVYWFLPELFFSFPKQQLNLWLMTLLIYPIVSVVPQEVIFRTFFFHRYKAIIPSKNRRWVLSTLSFSFAHIVYGNWVAVLLSSVAGIVFGYRYMHTRSTLVVVVEHTLWGSFMFTLGIGGYLLAQNI